MKLLAVAVRLEELAKEIRDSLSPPPEPVPPPPAPPALPLPPAEPSPSPTSPIQSYKDDYKRKWALATIHADKIPQIERVVRIIQNNDSRYQSVANQLNITYWPLIGIIHNLESNMDFFTHLHNGDPLIRRTTHVPIGRPILGHPPFTWEESAIDALSVDQHWNTWNDWTITGMGYLLERYNGFGYRQYHNIPSPYLWAGTNIYTSGRYIGDGKFDPNSISQQIGGMTILKFLSLMI